MFCSSFRCRLTFFDRSVIRRNWRKINESPMKKAGLLVRRIARGSIRRGRLTKAGYKRPSKPGRPPKSWREGKPFKMIYSIPGRLGASVLVGMVGFGQRGEPPPGLMEHGGKATRKVNIREKGRVGRNKLGRFISVRAKRRKAEAYKRLVKEGRIRESHPASVQAVRYPSRPFMQPALMKAKPRLPRLWRGSLGA